MLLLRNTKPFHYIVWLAIMKLISGYYDVQNDITYSQVRKYEMMAMLVRGSKIMPTNYCNRILYSRKLPYAPFAYENKNDENLNMRNLLRG